MLQFDKETLQLTSVNVLLQAKTAYMYWLVFMSAPLWHVSNTDLLLIVRKVRHIT